MPQNLMICFGNLGCKNANSNVDSALSRFRGMSESEKGMWLQLMSLPLTTRIDAAAVAS